jgi:hypothetical protein
VAKQVVVVSKGGPAPLTEYRQGWDPALHGTNQLLEQASPINSGVAKLAEPHTEQFGCYCGLENLKCHDQRRPIAGRR